MSKEGNIDDIFKEKLTQVEIAPSDAVWARIEKDLNSNPGRKKFWIFSLMTLLVSSMVIGGLIYKKPTTHGAEQNMASNLTIGQTQSETFEAEPPKSIEAKETINTNSKLSEIEDFTQKTKPEDINQSKLSKVNTSTNRAYSAGQKNENHLENETPIIPIETVNQSVQARNETNTELTNIREPNSQTKVSDLSITGFEPEFIRSLSVSFQPILPLFTTNQQAAVQKGNNKNWMVGAFVEGNWNLKHINSYSSGAKPLVQDSILKLESTTVTPGFGLQFAFQWNSNWRITSGIAYTKWCRKADYPIDIPIDPTDISSNPNGAYNAYFEGPTGEQNISVSNELLNDYESLTSIPIDIEFDLHVHECYEVLSVPLRVGYEYYFSNFSVIPELGLNYQRIINNSISANASNDIEDLNFTRQEDYNKDILSVSGGLGIERYISRRLKVGLNGTYQYWVTPLYKSAEFNTHPYTVSGQVRVWYIISK